MRSDRRRRVLLPDTWNEPALETGESPTDCPECGVEASVLASVCQVCFAELDEVAPIHLPAAS